MQKDNILFELIEDIQKDKFIKIVFSDRQNGEFNKIIIKSLSLKNGKNIQIESFKENKAFHKNIELNNIQEIENILKEYIENIKNEISKINNNLEIITDDYRTFPKEWFGEILNKNIDNKIIDKNFSLKTHINLRTFSKENINLKTMDELGLFLNRLVNGDFGKIYRAKGIVKIDGYWGKFNLVYKNFEMEPITDAKGTKIVIIGNNLDIDNLKDI